MDYPRLAAVVTALMLLSSGGVARAEYSLVQLQVIESFIASKNWQQLYDFLKSNPALLQGDDPLVRELNAFLIAYEAGQDYDFAPLDDLNALQPAAPAVPVPTPPTPIY